MNRTKLKAFEKDIAHDGEINACLPILLILSIFAKYLELRMTNFRKYDFKTTRFGLSFVDVLKIFPVRECQAIKVYPDTAT